MPTEFTPVRRLAFRSLVAGVVAAIAPVLAFAIEPERAKKWEPEIAGIEKRLKQNPSAKDCVAFVGSSTIRMWDVKKSFPDMNVVNLGFGGSEIRDSTHFAPRILLPLDPKAIVFYAGDNDLASGRKPAQVRDDFREFVGVVRAKLPTTPILFLCVKPSIQRWSQFEKQKEANALVKALCSEGSHLVYVDLIPGILGTDGKPKAELFAKDGLHLNPKGYEVLNAEVKAFFSRR